MIRAFWVLISYLLGSIPAALIAGRWMRGIDLREFGSGNLGATNVYRVLGLKSALAVFAFDVLKGLVPVLLFPRLTPGVPSVVTPILYGVGAIVGHIRPIYLRGQGGGKGVATATGVFFALAPVPMILAVSVWIAVFALTRFVSLASMFAAGALPAAVAIWYGSSNWLFAGSAAVSLFVAWTHRKNIERLSLGTEPRIARRGLR
jgi:glycerol-3-phosphate acyltransferase PlsY